VKTERTQGPYLQSFFTCQAHQLQVLSLTLSGPVHKNLFVRKRKFFKLKLIKTILARHGMHAWDPKARGSQVQGQSGLHSKTRSQKKKKKKNPLKKMKTPQWDYQDL
jgi:hypothetical protein